MFHKNYEKIIPLSKEWQELSKNQNNWAQNNWHNWKWQIRSKISSLYDLTLYFPSFKKQFSEYFNIKKDCYNFPVAITPYYASLLKKYENECNLMDIVFPNALEFQDYWINERDDNESIKNKEVKKNIKEIKSQRWKRCSNPGNFIDPLSEKKHMIGKNLIYRYPDRVLFLLTSICSCYCRYCTRKYYIIQNRSQIISKINYEKSIDFISRNKNIKEVILSGGDPLILSNNKLKKIIQDLRKVKHLEIIRLASKMLVNCPMRIDDELVKILKMYNPIFMMTHFNHPREVSFQAKEAIDKLTDNGILIFNQTVLLNGVNNHSAILKELFRKLLLIRVKPYYLFQCDVAIGTSHFQTSLDNFYQIQKELWGYSGLLIPNYCVDIPGGGGKFNLSPSSFIEKFMKEKTNDLKLEGFDGVKGFFYNNQVDYTPVDAKNYIKKEEKYEYNDGI